MSKRVRFLLYFLLGLSLLMAVSAYAQICFPVGQTENWDLLFSDEFDGTTLDLSKWRPNWLESTDTAITQPVNDQEITCYDPAQANIDNGELQLTAESRSCLNWDYASGLVQSNRKFSFMYGYVEARVWMPPATERITYHLHFPDCEGGCVGDNIEFPNLAEGWHTYAVNWEPEKVTWIFDGVPVATYTEHVPNLPMYMVFNIGVKGVVWPSFWLNGNDWEINIFEAYSADLTDLPATLRVDYVRVWDRAPSGIPVSACGRTCVEWQLYQTNQTGDWEIFRLGDLTDRQAFSANLSQGTTAKDMAPSLSPNAEWIVFSSDRDGNREIYAAPTDGDSSRIRRLTYNNYAIDTDPVWGPHNFIAFETTRNGNWDLYLIDMTTGEERQLTHNPANDINAFWSTDGTKLLFQSDRSGKWQIYEFDIAADVVTQLTDGTANEVDPQYSNDDRRIVYRSYRDGETSTLYTMEANGRNPWRISDVAGDATNPAWSPNDQLIAYQSDLDGDLDIYVYEVATGNTRKLTDNSIHDYAPTWKCDTTELLFTSDASTNPDIYSANALPINAPAIDVPTEAVQLTTDPADDVYPESSPVEENASREGYFPLQTLGLQTLFLEPDVSLTPPDVSFDSGEGWETIQSCVSACPS